VIEAHELREKTARKNVARIDPDVIRIANLNRLRAESFRSALTRSEEPLDCRIRSNASLRNRIMAPYQYIVILLTLVVATPSQAEQLSPDELKFFETKIRPVLIKECYGCHSNESGNVRGGLRLDTKELMHIGGGTGPAVVPGDLEESWLYNAITYQDYEMPPKRKLPQNVIDDFRKWIEIGAPDPRVTKTAEIKSSITADDIRQAKASFWAYQKPEEQDLPSVENTAWARTAIDQFILAELEDAGLQPTQDSKAWKVLRRLHFDLVGLPPSPRLIEHFQDAWRKDPDLAIATEVDRLLATQQFGERWGRNWLDVVRYAESSGREVNMTYPHAWRYRDYVIDSFNDDKPFDQFVQEQIAGDLLPANSDSEWAENLIATTFLAIGPKNVNEQNRVQFAADVVDEQIDATSRVFLGMSVACARCHDHKFDPIPQTDYYALAGIFRNMRTYFGNPQSDFGRFQGAQEKQTSSLILLPVDDPNPFDKQYSSRELELLSDEIRGKLGEMSALRRNRSRDSGGDANSQRRARLRLNNELSALSGKLATVDNNGMPRSYCMGVQQTDSLKSTRLLVRGEIDQPAQLVSRGFPQVLCSTPVTIDESTAGRLELARWIGSDENPLTARVMVNRIWQHMIGQGIVPSTENFGSSGQAPSHSELLDYLALRFVESGWSVKAMVREIATSRVYRIGSEFNKDYHEYEPDNALVWRATPRRLTAEAIRDAMLSISGEIELARPRGSEVAKSGYTRVRNGTLGNRGDASAGRRPGNRQPSAGEDRRRPPRGRFGMRSGGLDRETRRGAPRMAGNPLDMEDAKFRSVYLTLVRDEEPRSLEVFDFADSSAIVGTRESSNTANQALYMMNNRFVIQQSDALARRVAEISTQLPAQIRYLFLLTYGRQPTSGERSAVASFVRRYSSSSGDPSRGHETLRVLCHSLLASAEFRMID
jgi:hypothetical protein